MTRLGPFRFATLLDEGRIVGRHLDTVLTPSSWLDLAYVLHKPGSLQHPKRHSCVRHSYLRWLNMFATRFLMMQTLHYFTKPLCRVRQH